MPQDVGSLTEDVRGNQSFDELYYREGCGPDPYERNETWLSFYAQIVEQIVRSLHPRTVFDAGCALGMMVEAFWDRGIQASGVDVSEYAIASVRPDMREHCGVASLVQPFADKYDLVTCIEVLEHMPAGEAVQAIRNISDASDTVLFSSSPVDFNEVTHVNVRPTLSWLRLFGEYGLWPDLPYDASFLLPHAMLLRRGPAPGDSVLVLFVEKLRLQQELSAARRRVQTLEAARTSLAARHVAVEAEVERRQLAIQALETELDTARSAVQTAEAARASAVAEIGRATQQIEEAASRALATAHEDRARAIAALTQQNARALASANEDAGRVLARTREEGLLAHSAAEQNLALLRAKADEAAKLAHMVEAKEAEASALRHALAAAESAGLRLAAVESSTSWRMTAGLRGAFGSLPQPLKRQLRRGAKLGWWLLTPHRMPQRLRAMTMREASAVRGGSGAGGAIAAGPARQQHLPESPAPGGAETRQMGLDPAPSPTDWDVVARSPLFDADWYAERYGGSSQPTIDAARHYVECGADSGHDPGPRFSTEKYLARYPDVARAGLIALVHYEKYGRAAGLAISWSRVALYTTADVLDGALWHLKPLPLFAVTRGLKPRVTLITDSTAASHFYGGVGTATVMAALWAKRRGAALRVATLRAEPARENVANMLRTVNVAVPDEMEFRHVDIASAHRPMDLGADDVFLTTSWWSTLNALAALPAERLIYILQEDERMFYPAGDDQLRAEEAMNTPGLKRVVNTRLLYDYLANSGIAALDTAGCWFEPAFPEQAYFPGEPPTCEDAKLRLFFYARPQNSRNLYLRGLEALNAAVTSGVLPMSQIDVHFVGKDLVPLTLPGGYPVTLAENLPWDRYLQLLRTMDLGLSLMLTPHPSYPPLDLVACGAVAVTNTWGPKQSLSMYSDNLICAEPTVDALVAALGHGLALAKDRAGRKANYARQGLARSWETSFAPVFEWLDRA